MSTFCCPACGAAKRWCRRCKTTHCQCSWNRHPEPRGTAAQLRAWSILRTKGPLNVYEFAAAMWPTRFQVASPLQSEAQAIRFLVRLASIGLVRKLVSGAYEAIPLTECAGNA